MPVRVALLTEGGYPYVQGEVAGWCDRLLRGLDSHEFEVYALSRSRRQEQVGRVPLPGNVVGVREAGLWDTPGRGPEAAAMPYGRRVRRWFRAEFGALADAVCRPVVELREGAGQSGRVAPVEDRFSRALHGLAALAAEHGGLPAALRSEDALHALESACRRAGAPRVVQSARVPDLLAVAARLERALRPLSLDWYGARGTAGLAAADLVHAVGAGPAVLPGLLARRNLGTPLLLTEYGVRLREHFLHGAGDPGVLAVAGARAPVRAVLAAFQQLLVREAYRTADLITPGNAHTRRWQERCGAPVERLRTVHPGMDASPYAELGEAADVGSGQAVLTWVGRLAPAKDVVTLLHALVRVRERVPGARLRIVADHGSDAAYAAHCRAVAAGLFPDEATGASGEGRNPVSFEGALPGPGCQATRLASRADAFAGEGPVVLSSVVEGFPVPLVEAMFCARATVATDVGAVCEVVGGTGLVVPPRNPAALADACASLLLDPQRRARLGAAARARALELFTVEQNVEAFRGIYLELISRRSGGPPWTRAARPFAVTAETHLCAYGEEGPANPPPQVPTWARGGRAASPVPAGTARAARRGGGRG